jgi:hypothetical protein
MKKYHTKKLKNIMILAVQIKIRYHKNMESNDTPTGVRVKRLKCEEVSLHNKDG